MTDAVLGNLKELDISALAIGSTKYQELLVSFLPEEHDRFLAAIGKIEKLALKGGSALLARFADFDRIFDAVVTVKRVRGIHNSAVALRTCADLALKALESEEASATQAPAPELIA